MNGLKLGYIKQIPVLCLVEELLMTLWNLRSPGNLTEIKYIWTSYNYRSCQQLLGNGFANVLRFCTHSPDFQPSAAGARDPFAGSRWESFNIMFLSQAWCKKSNWLFTHYSTNKFTSSSMFTLSQSKHDIPTKSIKCNSHVQKTSSLSKRPCLVETELLVPALEWSWPLGPHVSTNTAVE